jgi:hypothetical protein
LEADGEIPFVFDFEGGDAVGDWMLGKFFVVGIPDGVGGEVGFVGAADPFAEDITGLLVFPHSTA